MKKKSWLMMGGLFVLCLAMMGFGPCDLQSQCQSWCSSLPLDLCGLCSVLPGG